MTPGAHPSRRADRSGRSPKRSRAGRIAFLYHDANAIAGHPFYDGILEGLTALTMISAGSISLFTSLTETAASRRARVFLCAVGLLTFALGLDDLFMLHESAWFFS